MNRRRITTYVSEQKENTHEIRHSLFQKTFNSNNSKSIFTNISDAYEEQQRNPLFLQTLKSFKQPISNFFTKSDVQNDEKETQFPRKRHNNISFSGQLNKKIEEIGKRKFNNFDRLNSKNTDRIFKESKLRLTSDAKQRLRSQKTHSVEKFSGKVKICTKIRNCSFQILKTRKNLQLRSQKQNDPAQGKTKNLTNSQSKNYLKIQQVKLFEVKRLWQYRAIRLKRKQNEKIHNRILNDIKDKSGETTKFNLNSQKNYQNQLKSLQAVQIRYGMKNKAMSASKADLIKMKNRNLLKLLLISWKKDIRESKAKFQQKFLKQFS